MAVSERIGRVRQLADLLECLPPQSRAEVADKLDGLGYRVDPAARFPAEEIEALAEGLWFLAVPARRIVAYQLRACGVTVHPDEATLEIERQGPAWQGKHAPQHPVRKKIAEDGTDLIAHFMPELAEKMAQAKTDQEKAALGAQMLGRHKAAAAEAQDLASRTRPEDLG